MMQQRFNVGDKVIYARSADGGEPSLEGKQAVVLDYREHQHTRTAYYDLEFQDGTKYTSPSDRLDPTNAEFVIFDFHHYCHGKFPTLESAIARAESQAKKSPGLLFTVVQAVAHVKAEQPSVTVTRL